MKKIITISFFFSRSAIMTGTWWNSMEVRPRRMLFIWVMPSMPLSWQSSVISLQKCLWPTPNLSSLMPISCSASETPFTETWSTPSWKSAFWNDPTSSAKFVFKQLSQVLALNLTCRFFPSFSPPRLAGITNVRSKHKKGWQGVPKCCCRSRNAWLHLDRLQIGAKS